MLDLDSPRWAQLQHAYGSAEGVPDIIRRIAAESVPTYSDHPAKARENPAAWDDVYSALYHQGSIYSATFAALPHFVAIAESGSPEQRLAIFLLVGAIRVTGMPDLNIPLDLIEEFEASVAKMRQLSLSIFRQPFNKEQALELPYMIQAFAGLRFPKLPYLIHLENFVEGHYELEIEECPSCGEYMIAEMRKDGPVTAPIDDKGHGPIEEKAAKLEVDRSDYPSRIERSREILDSSDDPAWEESETLSVLAALAEEKGATDLATRILDLSATVKCPHCECEFVLADELKS